MADQHYPVMCNEMVAALVTDVHGRYIDATFGRGGHAKALLGALSPDAQLLLIDQDKAAIAYAQETLAKDPRVRVEQASFSNLSSICDQLGWVGQVTGVMADLGVSSPQLDDPNRGFSFMRDGPLDMRMNTDTSPSAKEWLVHASEKEIADVLFHYGQERYARRIARALVGYRRTQSIDTTHELAEIIRQAHPRWPKHHHPATKSFQAIRIFINKELDALTELLPQIQRVLALHGRMACLSFHSLEDRMIKQFVQAQGQSKMLSDLPLTESQRFEAGITKMRWVGKFQVPIDQELSENPRSRSAKLRVAEKVGVG